MKTIKNAEFLKTFQILSYMHSKWDVWRDFIFMTACSISNAVSKNNYEKREMDYIRTISRYEKRDQRLFPKLFSQLIIALDNDPDQDFLGTTYTQLGLNNGNLAQIFTPYDVCKLMSRISLSNLLDEIKLKGYATICDPACGAGATLISAANEAKELLKKEHLNFQNHILMAGQDIDETAGLMCYIQLSLMGLAGFVKIGDSLSNPISRNDKLDNYWFTPMYYSKIWTRRRSIGG